MPRHEEWAIIEPLLPNKPRGAPRVDDRRVTNGILWRFRTGAPSGGSVCLNRFGAFAEWMSN